MKERHEYPGVYVLLNEDWHFTNSDCLARDHVTWAPEGAVTSRGNLAKTTPTVPQSHQSCTINTHSSVWKQTPNLNSTDLSKFSSRLRTCYWALTCPRGFHRGSGVTDGGCWSRAGKSRPWQPVIVLQRLMVSCCHCVSVGSRPTADAEQIIGALSLDFPSVTHMWIWRAASKKVSQVSRKLLRSSFISGRGFVSVCSEEEVRLSLHVMKQESISFEGKSVCKSVFECIN